MARELSVLVYRYDPAEDGEPHYDRFEVPMEAGMTVLEVLRYIYERLDGTLAFRWSCGIGKCGSCAVRFNGRQVLSCRQLVGEDLKEATIEPLANYPVVKDLIVDRERYQSRLEASLAHLKGLERVPAFLVPRSIADEAVGECIECLACDGGCPVLAERVEEYPGPALLTNLAVRTEDRELKNLPLDEVSPELFRCLQCGRCSATCRGGVSTDSLILTARERLARRGLLPGELQAFAEALRLHHNVSGDDNAKRLIWAQNLEGELAAPGLKGPIEVLYFVGCLGSFFPSSYGVPQALARILGAAGVSYGLMGGEEWCCGYPLMLSGMTEQAKTLAKHNLDAVRARGASRLVMTCPSCYYTWKSFYSKIEGELGLEIMHAAELLEALWDEGRLPLGEVPMRVTYHDPCDLGRKSGIYEAPRRILGGIPGLELVEMADSREASLCCGGGSNLETYDPQLMRKVARKRLGQALDTGAEAIITACAQCERTLKDAARKERARIRVMDIAELVWKSVEVAKERQRA